MNQHGPSELASPRFPTTHWSLVGRAVGQHGEASAETVRAARAALGELIRLYLPALRAHLVGPMRIDPHRADDLLQGFLADRVLQQNLIAAADPDRGKFRTFLLTALERFVIDVHRHDSARKRSPGSSLLDVDDQSDPVDRTPSPSDAFDRAWAGEVLSEVMRRLYSECRETARPHLWGIFEARMLLPITDGIVAPSHEELARRWKLESATQSANALGSAKRLFTRHFRAVVAEYSDPDEVEDEIRELWDIFSRPPA